MVRYPARAGLAAEASGAGIDGVEDGGEDGRTGSGTGGGVAPGRPSGHRANPSDRFRTADPAVAADEASPSACATEGACPPSGADGRNCTPWCAPLCAVGPGSSTAPPRAPLATVPPMTAPPATGRLTTAPLTADRLEAGPPDLLQLGPGAAVADDA
ncbi:hypothetical protein ACFV9B_23220, partial [Kitasatospora purpeofusca]